MTSVDKISPALQIHLKKAGYSTTKPRVLVFIALQEHERLTMNQLYRQLGATVDRTTVYRVIDLFEKLNIVQRVNNGWKYTLELTDEFTPHHHHFTCTNCGKVIDFEEPQLLEDMLGGVADTNGFQVTGHTLEITGFCQTCRQAKHPV